MLFFPRTKKIKDITESKYSNIIGSSLVVFRELQIIVLIKKNSFFYQFLGY